jgi:hypothetical protein
VWDYAVPPNKKSVAVQVAKNKSTGLINEQEQQHDWR